MKPKTKIHFEILKLHNKLPKITETQVKWAYKQCFKLYVWKTKHKAVCFECGFNNRSNFFGHFKRITGLTPVEYKRKCHCVQIPQTIYQ